MFLLLDFGLVTVLLGGAGIMDDQKKLIIDLTVPHEAAYLCQNKHLSCQIILSKQSQKVLRSTVLCHRTMTSLNCLSNSLFTTN